MTIKRYWLMDKSREMEAHIDGEWVRFDDVAAALTERDILLKKLEVAGEEHDEIFAENVELKARLDTTQAKLDEANKHISTTSLERSLERARLADFVRRAREIDADYPYPERMSPSSRFIRDLAAEKVDK